MSASTPITIRRFTVGTVYLDHEGRRRRVTQIRNTSGAPKLFFVYVDEPSLEHSANFYAFQREIESVLE